MANQYHINNPKHDGHEKTTISVKDFRPTDIILKNLIPNLECHAMFEDGIGHQIRPSLIPKMEYPPHKPKSVRGIQASA